MTYLTTEEFVALAERLHHDQITKTGKRYFGHPIRVREIGRELARKEIAANPEQFSLYDDYAVSGVSILDKVEQTCTGHDLLEDQKDKVSKEDLLTLRVHPHVVGAIILLTKLPGEKYTDAVERAKSNPISRIGKMADNTHNSQLSRVATLDEPLEDTIQRHTKYMLSYCYLQGRIDKETFRLQLKAANKTQKAAKSRAAKDRE